MNYKLDWYPNHDQRSRDYPVRTAAAKALPRFKQWAPGPVLDQGREGQCVAFGWVAEAMSTPVRVDFNKVKAAPVKEPQRIASYIYKQAQAIDEWPGEDYDGTSVNAGAKIMRNLGLVKEYRWAFGVNDMIPALTKGPVVIGIPWYESMYEAPNGKVVIGGRNVGGHCLLVTGYDTRSGTPVYTWRNSWGNEYGTGGSAQISHNDLGFLLKQQGEACVVTKRSYGR